MEKGMNILYVLGKGSPYNNDELRYSLRSLERFGKNIGRVIVVGEDPGFLSKEVEFYRKPEVKGHIPHRITNKVLYAIDKAGLDGDFLLIADDVFFTKETDLAAIPYEYKGYLRQRMTHPDQRYFQTVLEAAHWLEKSNCPTLDYEMHKPFLFNGKQFLKLKHAWKHSKDTTFGMVLQSVYGNYFNVGGTRVPDVKIKHLNRPSDFEVVKENYCITCGDGSWLRGIEDWCKQQFPNPCKYEIS